jgi:hypothetical protein
MKGDEGRDWTVPLPPGKGRVVIGEGGRAGAVSPSVPVTPCDPELKAYLIARFETELVESALGPLERTLMPDLGSLLNLVPADQRSPFLRFWTEELLTVGLMRDHPWPSLMPHRCPPSLAFTVAALEEHRPQMASEAYLFCLNLLVVFALGWQPHRPLDPTLPWRSKELESSRLKGGKGGANADMAREYLVDNVLARKIAQVARNAHTRNGGGLRDIALGDVLQEARMLAMRLISGDAEEMLIRAAMSGGDLEKELTPLGRPLEPRRTAGMREGLAELEQRQEESGPFSRGDYERWARALHVVTGERLAVLEEIVAGRRPPLKSFWPYAAANVVTHLFGILGRPGRLYQELRDWLLRESKARQIMEEWATDQATGTSTSTLSAEDFDKIQWQRLLGSLATPLNLAILEARLVDMLHGRDLLIRLLERGFPPLSAGAIRQRLRHMKKLDKSQTRS